MNNSSNALIHETSPYLLQHAHNPVHWHPWGPNARQKAKDEDKLIILSIGYSSCHWCHVMERESFEDTGVAWLMNEHFISIKVDREERPDVDDVYMTALQLMTGQGGWPLNVVALPDGRPVWGATYLPRDRWMASLDELQRIYREDPAKMEDYAEKLTAGVQQVSLVEANPKAPDFSPQLADRIFQNWQTGFDTTEGGRSGAPKFPMPSGLRYLLHYGHLTRNKTALDQLQLTLRKMALGGIYDQVGGGFARYSTDEAWVAPHFEKMLYDNAQLVSLYSRAYQKFKDSLYAKVIRETLTWLDREMTGPEGEFYAALDADSEGEEGKFYTWREDELREVIPSQDWEEFSRYYDLPKGQWEGKIILVRSGETAATQKTDHWRNLLLEKRSERPRPGLDDKSLTSWNALMTCALVDAHLALEPRNDQDKVYLKRAIRNATWLLENQARDDDRLYHSYKAGQSSVDGLLEDYAFAIQAFLKLFEATAETSYLQQAARWADYVEDNFRDTSTGLFFTRNHHSEALFSKSQETFDNVIPAANSVMAQNFFRLGHYLDRPTYGEAARHMLHQIGSKRLIRQGESYSNWCRLLLWISHPYYEVAIAGPDAKPLYREIHTHYQPQALWIWARQKSELPLLQDRFISGDTRIYVCQNKVCQLPVKKVSAALNLMD